MDTIASLQAHFAIQPALRLELKNPQINSVRLTLTLPGYLDTALILRWLAQKIKCAPDANLRHLEDALLGLIKNPVPLPLSLLAQELVSLPVEEEIYFVLHGSFTAQPGFFLVPTTPGNFAKSFYPLAPLATAPLALISRLVEHRLLGNPASDSIPKDKRILHNCQQLLQTLGKNPKMALEFLEGMSFRIVPGTEEAAPEPHPQMPSKPKLTAMLEELALQRDGLQEL